MTDEIGAYFLIEQDPTKQREQLVGFMRLGELGVELALAHRREMDGTLVSIGPAGQWADYRDAIQWLSEMRKARERRIEEREARLEALQVKTVEASTASAKSADTSSSAAVRSADAAETSARWARWAFVLALVAALLAGAQVLFPSFVPWAQRLLGAA